MKRATWDERKGEQVRTKSQHRACGDPSTRLSPRSPRKKIEILHPCDNQIITTETETTIRETRNRGNPEGQSETSEIPR